MQRWKYRTRLVGLRYLLWTWAVLFLSLIFMLSMDSSGSTESRRGIYAPGFFFAFCNVGFATLLVIALSLARWLHLNLSGSVEVNISGPNAASELRAARMQTAQPKAC